jgi:hypothetical protein
MTRKFGTRLAAGALVAAVTAASAHAVDTLRLAIGVRETGTLANIGENGGTVVPPGTSQIEWVNGPGLVLNADDTWQQFTYTFGTDPVSSAFGVGNGTLSSPNMKGTLEHILVRNSTPTTSEIKFFLDDLTLIVNNSNAGTAPGTYVLADWEAQTPGTPHMFLAPRFSGSSSGFLAATPDVSTVVDGTTTPAHGGNHSHMANFKFAAPNTGGYLRLTTSTYNPTIDFAAGNQITFWAKATIAPPTMFWNSDSSGNWFDGSKWSNSAAEPIPGNAIDAGTSSGGDSARFMATLTQPRTVTLTQDTFLNQLLVDANNSFTFSSTPGGPSLVMTSTAAPPTAGSATIATVNSSHTVAADVYLNSSLTLSVAGAGNTLNVNGPIALLPTVTTNPHLTINKQGAGTLNVNDLTYGYLIVGEGTMTVAPGKALNLVFNESAATIPVVPNSTSRQAIFVQPAGTLNLTNTSPTLSYRFNDTDPANEGGVNQSGTYEASILNDGVINMSGGTLSTTRITISLVRGDLNLSNGASVTANYLAQDVVSIANSTINIRPNGGTNHLGGVSSIQGLSITGTGVLELNNNDLAIYEGAALAATVRGYLLSGRAGGTWTGVGIRSAAAAADAQLRTALGYATGAQLFGASNGSISGHGLTPNGFIVKYTWYGDATLDGKVDLDDYARIDRGYAMGLSTWVDGDFDYNGIIDAADYLLIDRVFGHQSGLLSPDLLATRQAQFGADYVSQLIAAVPEPAALGVIGLIGAALTTRRRRTVAN